LYSDDPERVVIDLTGSHVWDASTVAALDAIEMKYVALGKKGKIVRMQESTQPMRGGG
jgi:SulP family sulfate permease